MLTNLLRRAAFDSSGGSSCTLLSRVQADEVAAWERLVALYEPLVVLWCRAARLPDADVKQTVEMVFRAIAVGVADFHPDRLNCSFRNWVRTITRNTLAEGVSGASCTAASEANADPELTIDAAAFASELSDEDSLLFGTALQLVKSEFSTQTFDVFLQTVLGQQAPQAVAEQQQIDLESVRHAKSRVLFRLREEFGTLLD